MTDGLQNLDRQRERWRQARGPLMLIDTGGEAFAQGGLARFAPGIGVRFLVLPRDPQASIVSFDEPFWEWWMAPRPNPFPGAGATQWGRQKGPTVQAAVRYESWSGQRWEWDRYLAQHRSGALEFGLVRPAVSEWRYPDDQATPHRSFNLITILGRVWTAVRLFNDAITQLDGVGPWEVSLALINTKDTVLGNVGAGWMEGPDQLDERAPSLCPEPHVYIRRELREWPTDDGSWELTSELGACIEDAWGSEQRRFLAGIGDDAGRFDVSRYHD